MSLHHYNQTYGVKWLPKGLVSEISCVNGLVLNVCNTGLIKTGFYEESAAEIRIERTGVFQDNNILPIQDFGDSYGGGLVESAN